MTIAAESDEYLLIVDDEPGIRAALTRGLWEAGFPCAGAADGRAALAMLKSGRFSVMLSDMRMPVLDGMGLLREARILDPDLCVVMVTALAGLESALGAIRAGAYDYVTKPFQIAEVELVVRRALEHRRLKLENRRYVTQLEDLVQQRTEQVRRIGIDVITSLALTLEAKDEYTHDHSRRVGQLAGLLGGRMGLTTEEMESLRLAGLLHDIGKIGVRESVLLKSSPLTADEFRHVKLHAELGARILDPLADLLHIVPWIRHHHERWDGAGYPSGLVGSAIPLGARILGVADAYDAMRSDRPYRRGQAMALILEEVRSGIGHQFDPDIAVALIRLHESGELAELDATFPQDLPRVHIV